MFIKSDQRRLWLRLLVVLQTVALTTCGGYPLRMMSPGHRLRKAGDLRARLTVDLKHSVKDVLRRLK